MISDYEFCPNCKGQGRTRDGHCELCDGRGMVKRTLKFTESKKEVPKKSYDAFDWRDSYIPLK